MPPPDLPAPDPGAEPPVLPAAVLAAAATGHLETTLHDVLRTAVDHVGAAYGALGVLTPDARRLDRMVVVGADPQEAERIRRLPTGQAMRLLVDTPRVVTWDDFGQDPAELGFVPGHPAHNPFLVVPVHVGGAVFGNLYLTQKRSGEPFTAADVEVVQALAVVAGLAIGNARAAERAEQGRNWFLAGTEVATSLLSGAEPEDVLHDIADRVRVLAGADLAGVLVPGEDDDHLRVAAASGPGAADMEGVRIPLHATHVGEVYRSRTPTAIDDVSSDPVLGRHAEVAVEITRTLGPAFMTPFGQPPALGLVVAMRRKGREPFELGPHHPIVAFVTRAALAMELARSQRRERRLQVQADRDRIARDLHDHVVQRIFATVLSLDRLSRSLEASQPGIASRLGRSIDELDATIAEIRAAIFELQEDDDAAATVRRQLAEVVRGITEGRPLRRDLRLRGELDTLPRDLVPDLVAVVRELVTNVVRHSGAHRVTVAADVDGDGDVHVIVTDDGTGLPEVYARSGLANLADRAARRGGRLDVSSGQAGTEVRWTVPRP
ncbi:GAF domain-containing protein [Geodermatophilus sp. SYSU D00691]